MSIAKMEQFRMSLAQMVRPIMRLPGGLTGNLIPSDYGAMILDSNADGLVDGFAHSHSNETSVLDVEGGGQRVTLAGVSAVGAVLHLYTFPGVVVLSSTFYALSVDAALTLSGAERIKLQIEWRTAGGVFVSWAVGADVDPGATYSRQQFTATSPATAGLANLYFSVYAKALGATGSAWFKDALFQAA